MKRGFQKPLDALPDGKECHIVNLKKRAGWLRQYLSRSLPLKSIPILP